jgi:hypothetical protein
MRLCVMLRQSLSSSRHAGVSMMMEPTRSLTAAGVGGEAGATLSATAAQTLPNILRHPTQTSANLGPPSPPAPPPVPSASSIPPPCATSPPSISFARVSRWVAVDLGGGNLLSKVCEGAANSGVVKIGGSKWQERAPRDVCSLHAGGRRPPWEGIEEVPS